jgi:hypothetical protein
MIVLPNALATTGLFAAMIRSAFTALPNIGPLPLSAKVPL